MKIVIDIDDASAEQFVADPEKAGKALGLSVGTLIEKGLPIVTARAGLDLAAVAFTALHWMLTITNKEKTT